MTKINLTIIRNLIVSKIVPTYSTEIVRLVKFLLKKDRSGLLLWKCMKFTQAILVLSSNCEFVGKAKGIVWGVLG